MQKIFLWFIFLIIISIAIPFDSTSQNLEKNYLYQSSSTTSSGNVPAAMIATGYIIVDGPGTGTVLATVTDSAGTVLASPDFNPATKAEGHIGGIGTGEGMNCPGPLGHYHGTLRGQPDPDSEKCGWGHVDLLSNQSNGIQGVSQAYTNEISILTLIEKDPPDYDGAANAADMAAIDLAMLKDDINDPTKNMIGMGAARRIGDKLEKAINADKFVVMTLNPLPEKRDGIKDTAITLKINNALNAKQEAFMLLQNAEAMAAAMAGMAMGE